MSYVKSEILTLLRQNLRFDSYQSEADAAVLIALTNEPSPKVLLTKRASHLHKHAGEISFPGGKRELGDGDDIQVALRESQEEVGLEPFFVELVGELPLQYSRYGLSVKPIVGIIPMSPSLEIEPNEIETVCFVDIHEFIHSEAVAYPIVYHGQALNVASFQLQGEVIWGLTARMLVDLLQYGLHLPKKFPKIM